MKSAMGFILLLIASVPGLAQNAKPGRETSPASAARKPRVVMEEMFVQAKDPGIQIYVRNKLRAQGVGADGQKWSSGKPTYDPAKITVPVLLIQAEWDQDLPPYMARALFPLLVNAPEKRYVMIGEGTHTVMMEKNRMELFHEVQAFLDEGTAN